MLGLSWHIRGYLFADRGVWVGDMRMGAALLLGETGEEGGGGCGDGIHAREKGVCERTVVGRVGG